MVIPLKQFSIICLYITIPTRFGCNEYIVLVCYCDVRWISLLNVVVEMVEYQTYSGQFKRQLNDH